MGCLYLTLLCRPDQQDYILVLLLNMLCCGAFLCSLSWLLLIIVFSLLLFSLVVNNCFQFTSDLRCGIIAVLGRNMKLTRSTETLTLYWLHKKELLADVLMFKNIFFQTLYVYHHCESQQVYTGLNDCDLHVRLCGCKKTNSCILVLILHSVRMRLGMLKLSH